MISKYIQKHLLDSLVISDKMNMITVCKVIVTISLVATVLKEDDFDRERDMRVETLSTVHKRSF